MEDTNNTIVEKSLRNLKEYGNTLLITKCFEDDTCCNVIRFQIKENNTITIKYSIRKYWAPIFINNKLDDTAELYKSYELYDFNEEESVLPIISFIKADFFGNYYVSHDENSKGNIKEENINKAINKVYSYLEPALSVNLSEALSYYRDNTVKFSEFLIKKSLKGKNGYLDKPIDEIFNSYPEKLNNFKKTLHFAENEVKKLKLYNKNSKETIEQKKASY